MQKEVKKMNKQIKYILKELDDVLPKNKLLKAVKVNQKAKLREGKGDVGTGTHAQEGELGKAQQIGAGRPLPTIET